MASKRAYVGVIRSIYDGRIPTCMTHYLEALFSGGAYACSTSHVGQRMTVNRSVVMWMQVPWDYYAFRNGSRTRVLADIPPFGLALDGAWIAHYYIKVSQHARSAHVFLHCMIVMCFCLCAVL